MGDASKWTAVQFPRELAEEMEIFAQSDQGKKMGFTNKSQVAATAVRNFLHNPNPEQEISKIMVEKLGEAMDSFVGKLFEETQKNMKNKTIPLESKFPSKKGLQGISATKSQMKIKDSKLKKSVIVNIKNNKLYCSQDKTNECQHIVYACSNPGFLTSMIQQNIEIPGIEELSKVIKNYKNKN